MASSFSGKCAVLLGSASASITGWSPPALARRLGLWLACWTAHKENRAVSDALLIQVGSLFLRLKGWWQRVLFLIIAIIPMR